METKSWWINLSTRGAICTWGLDIAVSCQSKMASWEVTDSTIHDEPQSDFAWWDGRRNWATSEGKERRPSPHSDP
eukprot:1397014-Amphidinium_carterae.1